MKFVVVANSKGGVGKSLLVIGMASALHRAGYRVRVIDLDEQGTLAEWFEANNEGRYEPIPPDELLVESGVFSKDDVENMKLVRDHFVAVEKEGNYDFVIIDTKGEAATLTAMAMGVADLVLCPTDGSSAEYTPVILTFTSLRNALSEVDKTLDPNDYFRIVFNRPQPMVSEAVALSKKALQQKFKCVEGPNSSSSYNDAHFHGATIGQMIDRATKAANIGKTAAIRSGGKSAIKKHDKALTSVNRMLIELDMMKEPQNAQT